MLCRRECKPEPRTCHEGLPDLDSVVMMTLEELLDRSAPPQELLSRLFVRPLDGEKAMQLSKGLMLSNDRKSNTLDDCWPAPGHDLGEVCSRLKTFAGSFWKLIQPASQAPAALPQAAPKTAVAPVLGSMAPPLTRELVPPVVSKVQGVSQLL